MTLNRKIALGFAASSVLVVIMALFGYLEFLEIRAEIRNLELSDSIRSKTLQLRRHEKNYFLYRTQNEMDRVLGYLDELDGLLEKAAGGKLQALRVKANEYRHDFSVVVILSNSIFISMDSLKVHSSHAESHLIEYVKATIFDNPVASSELLNNALSHKPDKRIALQCAGLKSSIDELRRIGEDMLAVSKEIDKEARARVENTIHRLQIAIFVFLPLFLIIGLGISTYMSTSIMRRLQLLTDEIDKTKRGLHIESKFTLASDGTDEIDAILLKYRHLEQELAEREFEMIQSKKLSAIGTLASGVAHELNNPLNNIYTTAQRMMRKSGDEYPASVQKGLNDIFSQTMRVKKIVSDLLEFARTREPVRNNVMLYDVIERALDYVSNAIDMSGTSINSNLRGQSPVVLADTTQMEQVFINLITNAIEAMNGNGILSISVEALPGQVHVEVADSGKGLSAAEIEKIFEPFYSTKEKGTGLGLAVVYSIIKKHGGEIRVASAEGEGTIFFIDLPSASEERV